MLPLKNILKEVDERFFSQISQQGDKILTLLDQLREIISPNQGRDILDPACDIWAKWLSGLDGKSNLGYSNLKLSESDDGTRGVLLEAVVDSETHLFQMLFALKATLTLALKNPDSSEAASSLEILNGTRDIIEGFQSRQRMLGKIVNLKH